MKYDVFVSYRRSSFESANLIAEKMRSKGYSVFFDVETLRSGKFNEQLYEVIDNCNDFILVLPPNALDKCHDEGDWVRRELIRAMQCNKNIVPVQLAGFEWPSPMPHGLEELPNYQAIIAGEQEFFDMSMDRLAGYLKSKPSKKLRSLIYKLVAIVATILILASLSVVAVFQASKPICKNVATNVTSGMSILNLLYNKTKSVLSHWEEFINRYETARTEKERMAAISFYGNLYSNMATDLKFLHDQFTRLPQITSTQANLLGLHKIETNEIESFYGIYDAFFFQVDHDINFILSLLSNKKHLSEDKLRKHNTFKVAKGVELIQAMMDNVFYSYLELMSKFPKVAHEQYNIQSPEWKEFPETLGLKLSIEEYRVFQTTAYNRAENIVMQMEQDRARLEAEYETEKSMLNEFEKSVK